MKREICIFYFCFIVFIYKIETKPFIINTNLIEKGDEIILQNDISVTVLVIVILLGVITLSGSGYIIARWYINRRRMERELQRQSLISF